MSEGERRFLSSSLHLFQSMEGLGLTSVFIYLQPRIDFSLRERSITGPDVRHPTGTRAACQNSGVSSRGI